MRWNRSQQTQTIDTCENFRIRIFWPCQASEKIKTNQISKNYNIRSFAENKSSCLCPGENICFARLFLLVLLHFVCVSLRPFDAKEVNDRWIVFIYFRRTYSYLFYTFFLVFCLVCSPIRKSRWNETIQSSTFTRFKSHWNYLQFQQKIKKTRRKTNKKRKRRKKQFAD